MAKKITLTVKITYSAAHLKPENYDGAKTLKECLQKELKWLNAEDGQCDYLEMAMSNSDNCVVTDLVYEDKKSGKKITIKKAGK